MFIGYTDELRDFILLTPLFAILQTHKSGNLTQNKKKQKKDFKFTKKINKKTKERFQVHQKD